jgi:ABC-type transporter lipoprotein component MlaA
LQDCKSTKKILVRRWVSGVPSGPYIVLPMLGSSTLRDTAAMPVDMKDLWSYKEPVYPQFRYGSETGG